jgi:hypothetical protein
MVPIGMIASHASIPDMARLARIVLPDVPRHVSQRGNRRMEIFSEPSDFALYRDLLAAACELSRTVSKISRLQADLAYFPTRHIPCAPGLTRCFGSSPHTFTPAEAEFCWDMSSPTPAVATIEATSIAAGFSMSKKAGAAAFSSAGIQPRRRKQASATPSKTITASAHTASNQISGAKDKRAERAQDVVTARPIVTTVRTSPTASIAFRKRCAAPEPCVAAYRDIFTSVSPSRQSPALSEPAMTAKYDVRGLF